MTTTINTSWCKVAALAIDRTLALVAYALCVAALPSPLNADDAFWTGGGQSASMGEAANWSTDPDLPSSTMQAIVNSTNGVIPEVSGGTTTYYKLFVGTNVATTVSQSQGALEVTAPHPVILGSGIGGIGTYNISGGTLSCPDTSDSALFVGRLGGVGYLNISGDGIVNCQKICLGTSKTGSTRPKGYVTISGNGELNVRNEAWLGNTDNEYSEIVQGGGTFAGGYNVYLGSHGTVKYIKTGGKFTVARDLELGKYASSPRGDGTLEHGGGTITVTRYSHIGASGTGTYVQSGGSIQCNNWTSIGRYSGGTGYCTVTGGTFTVKNTTGLNIGEQGTGTLTVGGTGVVTAGDITFGSDAGAGSLYLNNGGRIITKSLAKGDSGTLNDVAFNGGTLEAVEDNASFLNNLGSMLLDVGGVEIDSAEHNIGISNSDFDETAGCSLVKKGEGTLTLAALPSAGSVSVDAGTLALSASCDNAVASLAHRWSFTSNLLDSVTRKYGVINGSGSSYVDSGNGTALRLPGGTSSKKKNCAVNLGNKKLPSNSATIEAWVTLRTVGTWRYILRIGGQDDDTGNPTKFMLNGSSMPRFDSVADSQISDKPLEKDAQYYVAFTYAPDGNGGVVTKRYIKKVGDDDYLWTNTTTKANWSVAGNAARGTFWLGRSDYKNDYDANADYDEVRVWNGALSDEAIALSAAKGPDATAADIAEIAASGTTVSRTLTVASGATLDVGAGNTLRQSVLNAGGTLANGRLEVAKGLVVTPGQTMTVASGATLDLSAVTEVALKDASAAVPAGGWVIATSSSGGIVFGTSELKLTGALSGYTLFITPTQARIGKVGLTLTFY